MTYKDINNRFTELVAEYIAKGYAATADPAVRKDIAWKVQAANYENAYLLPAYTLDNSVVYNAANISVPVEIFEVDGSNNYCWDQWAMLK